jgi:hypothetical protein
LVSSTHAQVHKDHNDNSARELTDEGAKLVKALIAKGIIKEEWRKNPFGEEDHYKPDDE